MATRALLGQLCRTSFLMAAMILLAACGGAALTDGPVAEATPSIDIPIEDLLVYVPAGPFYMGSDPELDTLAQEDEQPLHSILLDGYFIYRNEVSNGLYKQCVEDGECTDPTMFEDGPSTFYNHPDYQNNPVVGVTWDQASAFCGWADARLPTEAEWEKTSRGEDAELYPWGDDAPSCDLSNMAGCIVPPEDEDIPETEKIGQFPDGGSIYEANDLSGNVWEWTLDWYDEDYYLNSPRTNPLGPENGELRVVRGGSYEDGPDALRSAERMALDPDEAYNNVGFRCVPIGEDRAVTPPFCQQTYVPFCRDPHDDPNDGCEPVDTTDVTPTPSNNIDFGGFGCPDAGLITVTLESGTPISDDHTVTVGGVVFNCYDSTTYPGLVVCQGSPPPAGSITTVTVCPDGNANAGNAVAGLGQPQGPQPAQVALVAYRPQNQQQQPAGLQVYEPTQQPQAGLQAYQPTQAAPAGLEVYEAQQPANLVAYQAAANTQCPTGYLLNPTTGQCELDPNGACPEGWIYNEATGQCDLGEDGCPEGTTPGANGCTPDTGDECPAGWLYDEGAGTCQPPANNDGGGSCPAGYFYDQTINCCSPIPSDNVGCDPGFYRSVATNQCEPVDQNGCPDGTVYNRYEGGCVPDYGQDDVQTTDISGCRLAGYVRNENGVCVPGDDLTQRIVSVCDEGSFYDPQLGVCVQLEDGQCGPGYRLNPVSNTCVPNDGPGSGCAAGYSFSERYNCCVPTPGNDGSYCPGDESAQTGRLVSYPQPSTTGYDYGTGYCDPVGDELCPSGYAYDEQTQSCVAIVGRTVTVDGCPDGTYYDQSLGYCVQTSCGCELGYTYNPRTQTCEPFGGEPQTGDGCWSYQVSVPVCPYQQPTTPACDSDERWNQQTQRCEPDPEDVTGGGGGTPACGTYTSSSSCKAAGCTWTVLGAAAVCH
jgi:formylglycine-generating enzyme required for sulfatase activity